MTIDVIFHFERRCRFHTYMLIAHQLRIHRKLKEVAVFRYSKKVNKEDGSVRNIFFAQSFKLLSPRKLCCTFTALF